MGYASRGRNFLSSKVFLFMHNSFSNTVCSRLFIPFLPCVFISGNLGQWSKIPCFYRLLHFCSFFDVSLFANGGSLLLEEKMPKVPPIKLRASSIFPHFWFFSDEDDNRELLGTHFISSSPSHPAQRHLIFLPRREKNLFSLNLLLLFFITCRSPKTCESAPKEPPTVVFYSVDKSGDFYLFENWVPPLPSTSHAFSATKLEGQNLAHYIEIGFLKNMYFLAFQPGKTK